MEWHNWYVRQRHKREGLIPPSVTWDRLPSFYNRLTELAQHIPWKRRLVLHLCFRGIRIKIDLGDVKAAGIVAVLGLSFGLGSLLLYRLYYRYVHTKESIKARKEDELQNDDECHIYLESTDDSSPSKRGMGNVQSSPGVVASVHYSPAYGVAIGPKYTNNNGRPPWVRQRKLGSPSEKQTCLSDPPKSRVKSSSANAEKQVTDGDSDIGLPFEGAEKWCHDARTAKSRTALSPSLIVNCSPQSVQEKRFHYSQSDTKGTSAPGGYGMDKDSDENKLHIRLLQDSSVLLTPPDEDCVPYVRSAPHSDQNSVNEQSLLLDFSREASPYSGEENSYVESPSQAGSFRSSSKISEFDESEGEFGATSQLPRLSSLDRSFKHNLLKRLTEWTTLSHELGSKSGSGSGSGSISPDVRSTPERRMKRSITIGSTGSMSGIESPVTELVGGNDIGLRTSKNLEDIEDEIHQIFSEFDYLNSKLSDLKSRNNTSGRIEPLVPDDPEIMGEIQDNVALQEEIKEAYEHWCRQAQDRGLRGQSLPPIDSSGRLSSRGASFMERDLSWDAGDIAGDGCLFGKHTPNPMPSVWLSKDGDSVDVVNTLSTMGEELDDREWKQIEESTTRGQAMQLSDSRNTSRSTSRKGSISPEDSSITYDADVSSADWDTSSEAQGARTQETSKNPPILSVGVKIDIIKYSEQEWKGKTPKSEAIRKGYQEVTRRTGLSCMRIVRGDNYCAIRASLFQLFNQGIPVRLSRENVLQKLKKMVNQNTGGINSWNFANRIPASNKLFEKMSTCIQTFFNKVTECREEASDEQREAMVLKMFNSGVEVDLQLMEAVKLLMFIQAVDLYRDNVEGNQVATFVWLLFARDTSENPHLLLSNHINTIGDSGGLEQIEMCLLSYTLGVTIQVFRLADFGKADFEATFSGEDDHNSNKTTTLTLLAEDDRHYNVLVS